MSQIIGNEIAKDRRDKAKAAKKEAFDNSEEGRAFLIKSRIAQNKTLHKEKENNERYALLCEEQAYIFDKIVRKLKLDTDPKRDLSLAEIVDVLLKYESDIIRISTLSTELKKPSTDRAQGSPYERLFKDLVQLNPRFAYFAPRFAVNQSGINFQSLPTKELNGDMLQTLEHLDLMRDESFRKYYIHLFPKYISSITDFSTAKKALKLYPEQYPNLGSKIKQHLEDDSVILELLRYIPTLSSYMSEQELSRIAHAASSTLAKNIVINPSVLGNLSNSFFSRLNLPTFFQQVPKKKLIETCAPYFEKHTAIRDYAHSTSQHNIHSQAYRNIGMDDSGLNI